MGPKVSRRIGKPSSCSCHHVPMDVIQIPAMFSSANKTLAFLGFGNMHVPG